MATIHWLGAGLSSGPGIRRLAQQGRAITLWNRTIAKAQSALDGIGENADARPLDWEQLSDELVAGDVVVSMLPATMHMQIAELCLGKESHFVCSSYVSPQMRALDEPATKAGLSFLSEMGLDPGIDHLMAHALMDAYRRSEEFDKDHEHRFRSYCGGLSRVPNDFKYKFSWSPLGVLKALKSRATWIDDGETKTSDRPWNELSEFTVSLPAGNETFEAYPNRDSLPFMSEYGFGDDWNTHEFIRGTLRLNGWAEAWKDIFSLVDSTDGEDGDRILAEKSESLWKDHRLQEGELDRVVLSVELEVRKDDETIWHQSFVLDECGSERGSAMSRLVSLPVSLGVEAVAEGRIPAGVSAATRNVDLVHDWFDRLRSMGEKIERMVRV